MKDKIYHDIKDKKILLLGFGKEGKSTYRFLRTCDPKLEFGIADMKKIEDQEVVQDQHVTLYCGENYLDACYEYDLIIKGPGVIIKDYLTEDVKQKITCQTDLFLKFCPTKTIGITGTKGKSTTSSLLYHMLKKLNQKVILMGNIGIPCFDTLDEIDQDTICVLELGCHQLEYMKHSPNIAAILNVYEEHLDHYLSMQHYIDVKKNIYRYQNQDDYVLLANSPYLKDQTGIRGKVLLEATSKEDNCFYITEESLNIKVASHHMRFSKEKIHTTLKGEHNQYNILICLTIVHILNLDINKAITSISSFRGLPHRMEYIGTYHDILFYDDSIATSIPSVICAVNTLKDVNTIIVGGLDRGLDYQSLVDFLNSSTVENIILLPDTSYPIAALFKEKQTLKKIYMVTSMEEAISISKEKTQKNKICLLSPAAASYNQYQNFEERGDHFRSLVEKES